MVAAAMTIAAGGAVAQDAQRAGGTAQALQRGASGAAVAAAQAKLGVAADGVYGPVTEQAVRRFQGAQGLAADGVIGPATAAALGLALPRAGAARASAAVAGDASATLARIAQCESGGDPTAVSATGRYRGKYQFSRATWRWLGGTGDPAAAPEAEQDRRAAQLLARQGRSAWPNCA